MYIKRKIQNIDSTEEPEKMQKKQRERNTLIES